MNKKRQLYVNGKLIDVSEEVYRAYKREEWREAQREYRSKKCRNAKGVVCRKDCKTCPHYLEGNALLGATLSLDAFTTEDGSPVEFADTSVNVELEVARNILKEEVAKAKTQLDEREQVILESVLAGLSERMIAKELGLSNSRVHNLKMTLYKKLRGFLSEFSDYFIE